MLPLFDHRPSSPQPIVPPLNPFPIAPPRSGPSMDSAAADFRAFYPYTPNEVKHRKRTTNAQLKTLENVFRQDTKPNGPLRVELAGKLGMTARGVQVWFQNRRAKEKLKAVKAKKLEALNQDLPKPSSEDDTSVSAAASPAAHPSPPLSDSCGPLDSTTSSPVTASPSVPHIQIHSSQPTWETPTDPHSLASHTNLHRRGSLPVNALFPDYECSTNSRLDAFDPLARRLSVDTSLQRLANNPYAHLARAKNTALFGPRAVAPIRRPLSRSQIPPRSSASMPYPLDVRRASVGAFRVPPHHTTSPSPSPLSQYSSPRASLPDTQLYTARTLTSPLPGPLPSPNFSFGAANTPSMASTSSGGSERNSPDSIRAFPYREPDQEDEDGSTSYFPISRFNSIASVATSDSSFNSSYLPPDVLPYDGNLSIRRESYVSGPVASLMSNLDVNGIHDTMANGQEQDPCAFQKDMGVPGVIRVNNGDVCTQAGPYSTVSLDTPSDFHPLGTGPSPVPISQSSELAYALQSHQAASKSIPHTTSIVATVVQATIDQTDQLLYPHDMQQIAAGQANTAAEFESKYHYGYDRSSSYFPDNYSMAQGGNEHNQPFNASILPYRTKMYPLDPISPNDYVPYA